MNSIFHQLSHQMTEDKPHRLPEQSPSSVLGTASTFRTLSSTSSPELSRLDSTALTLIDDKHETVIPLKQLDSRVTVTSSGRYGSLCVPPAAFDLSLHPGLGRYGLDVLSKDANFLPDSRVDVLSVSGPKHTLAFHTDQSDAQVEATIDLLESRAGSPALMAICVKLETDTAATFEQKASISKSLAKNLFSRYDIHSGFLLDLVGRPNYWSALSQVKSDSRHHKEVFEFFCQHPRWHQKGRYDKGKGAMQGNKAPCSLYMTYSVATDTTVYLVVAPDDGIWFSFVDLIRDGHASVSGRELATSPFLVHSMMSNIAFEQATIYADETRVRLMTQLKKVNEYSDTQDLENMQAQDLDNFEARQELSSITRQLYSVSQMINTGLGSASSAVKLSVKLLEAHTQFCERTGRGEPGTAVSRTQTALQYVHDAYLYQQSWLEQYKTRKETAMGFVFNMVTQGDSSIALKTSYQMSKDSSSMHSVTVLSMIFLPGTFTATLFSSVAFRAGDSGAAEITAWLAPFVIVAIGLTITVLTVWYFRTRISDMLGELPWRRQGNRRRGRLEVSAV